MIDVLPDLTLLGCYTVPDAWIEFPQRLQGVGQGSWGGLNNDLAFPGGENTGITNFIWAISSSRNM
jgi:hypothetical protein